MSDEIILAKPYQHDAKNLWQACGFDPKEIETKITKWSPDLNSKMPSQLIEFIEGLDISNREKITLSYYVCGIQASHHVDRLIKEMTAVTAKQMEVYRQEIRRLGGSVNPLEFGKKKPSKRNRNHTSK